MHDYKKDLLDMQNAIIEQIWAHAKANGLTYEEAAYRARLTIKGKQVEPISVVSLHIPATDKKRK